MNVPFFPFWNSTLFSVDIISSLISEEFKDRFLDVLISLYSLLLFIDFFSSLVSFGLCLFCRHFDVWWSLYCGARIKSRHNKAVILAVGMGGLGNGWDSVWFWLGSFLGESFTLKSGPFSWANHFPEKNLQVPS